MLGAQSVPRSTNTSAETTAPLANSSIHAPVNNPVERQNPTLGYPE